VDATLPHLAPQVRAMVELQRLTGMRPQEVCLLRTIDVDCSGSTWVYTPLRHKREHHEKARSIHIGPQAQAILKPWLRPDDRTAYLFSPREAMEQRRAEMRRNRQTPVPPSQRNRKKSRPARTPGDRYEVSSYDHAIVYGIRRANKDAKKRNRPEVPHWHPNQLRHGAATRIRRAFGLDVARACLGHSSPVITEQYYAELDQAKAAEAMQRLG
jgi:integrase